MEIACSHINQETQEDRAVTPSKNAKYLVTELKMPEFQQSIDADYSGNQYERAVEA